MEKEKNNEKKKRTKTKKIYWIKNMLYLREFHLLQPTLPKVNCPPSAGNSSLDPSCPQTEFYTFLCYVP